MLPRPWNEDDVLIAYGETWCRFVAYRRAVADAGDDPDEGTYFALAELELALEGWRHRLIAALGRVGLPVEAVLGRAA